MAPLSAVNNSGENTNMPFHPADDNDSVATGNTFLVITNPDGTRGCSKHPTIRLKDGMMTCPSCDEDFVNHQAKLQERRNQLDMQLNQLNHQELQQQHIQQEQYEIQRNFQEKAEESLPQTVSSSSSSSSRQHPAYGVSGAFGISGMPSGMPGSISGSISGAMPSAMPGSMSGSMPGSMPGGMAGGMAGGMPGGMPGMSGVSAFAPSHAGGQANGAPTASMGLWSMQPSMQSTPQYMDAFTMQIQRMQQMQDWMLCQKEQEVQTLRKKVEEQQHELHAKSVQLALMEEKLKQQEDRMQQELKLLWAVTNNNNNKKQQTRKEREKDKEKDKEKDREKDKEKDREKDRNGEIHRDGKKHETANSTSASCEQRRMSTSSEASTASHHHMKNYIESSLSGKEPPEIETETATQPGPEVKNLVLKYPPTVTANSASKTRDRETAVEAPLSKKSTTNPFVEKDGLPININVDDSAPPEVPLQEEITLATIPHLPKQNSWIASNGGDRFQPRIISQNDPNQPTVPTEKKNDVGDQRKGRLYPIVSDQEDEQPEIDLDAMTATQSLTVASSTYGEDRQNVTDKILLDPYGDKGNYNGLILKSTGMPHGRGKMVYEEDQRVYEGEWRHGRWHGFGQAFFANGDSYGGEYSFDQRHGKGIYKWNDGRVYDGMFYEDRRHGQGTFRWPDGATYEGGFSNGQREGYGEYKFSDGGKYKGEWKDGRYNGHGECTWEDGRCYGGEWKNGMAHGKGVETYADGTIRHNGQWLNDEPVRELSIGGTDIN